MKHTFNNNIITLFLVGELNTSTSPVMEKEIDEILKNKNVESLVLDLKDLIYISSAGLRIVVKLKQKYDNISIIHCNEDVYDIFQMTGFAAMMNISK